MIRVELTCTHPPHQCRCRHNVQTQVNRQDLTSNLIKHNPALLRYLGKKNMVQVEPCRKVDDKPNINIVPPEGVNPNQPYRSIVEEKGLNFCLDYPQQKIKSPKSEPKELTPKNIIENFQPIPNTNPPEPIPDTKPPKKDPKSKEGHVQNFHKGLRQQSRYLSDTAFRKYFNRQCFQNYGRNNITHKADGFVYGNYMKTFNINPHTGQNMPINQETFYHALVSGSPEKYGTYTQEVKLGMTAGPQNQKSRERQIQKQKSFEKSKLDVQQMLVDNEKHNKMQKKYDHLHLKQAPKEKSSKTIQQSKSSQYPQFNIRQLKSPGYLQLNTKKHFNHLSIEQSKTDLNPNIKISKAESINPNAQSIIVQEVTPKNYQPKSSNISIKETIRQEQGKIKNVQIKTATSPKSVNCDHTQNQQTIECPGCLNRMKKMILQLSQKDPELAERFITSAQKNVRYKNFALNNYENAAKNPHNYRPTDGKLNIYEG